MVKFIIELSEDYISKNANAQEVLGKMDGNNEQGGGSHPLKKFFNLIAFTSIEKEVNNGKKEFVISRDSLDDKLKELFDISIGEFVMIASTNEKKEE